MIKRRKLNSYLVGFMLLLFVLLFPVKFKDGCTCLADRYLPINKSSIQIRGDSDRMVRRYIFPFGIIWWISLGSIITMFVIKNQKEDDNHERP